MLKAVKTNVREKMSQQHTPQTTTPPTPPPPPLPPSVPPLQNQQISAAIVSEALKHLRKTTPKQRQSTSTLKRVTSAPSTSISAAVSKKEEPYPDNSDAEVDAYKSSQTTGTFRKLDEENDELNSPTTVPVVPPPPPPPPMPLTLTQTISAANKRKRQVPLNAQKRRQQIKSPSIANLAAEDTEPQQQKNTLKNFPGVIATITGQVGQNSTALNSTSENNEDAEKNSDEADCSIKPSVIAEQQRTKVQQATELLQSNRKHTSSFSTTTITRNSNSKLKAAIVLEAASVDKKSVAIDNHTSTEDDESADDGERSGQLQKPVAMIDRAAKSSITADVYHYGKLLYTPPHSIIEHDCVGILRRRRLHIHSVASSTNDIEEIVRIKLDHNLQFITTYEPPQARSQLTTALKMTKPQERRSSLNTGSAVDKGQMLKKSANYHQIFADDDEQKTNMNNLAGTLAASPTASTLTANSAEIMAASCVGKTGGKATKMLATLASHLFNSSSNNSLRAGFVAAQSAEANKVQLASTISSTDALGGRRRSLSALRNSNRQTAEDNVTSSDSAVPRESADEDVALTETKKKSSHMVHFDLRVPPDCAKFSSNTVQADEKSAKIQAHKFKCYSVEAHDVWKAYIMAVAHGMPPADYGIVLTPGELMHVEAVLKMEQDQRKRRNTRQNATKVSVETDKNGKGMKNEQTTVVTTKTEQQKVLGSNDETNWSAKASADFSSSRVETTASPVTVKQFVKSMNIKVMPVAKSPSFATKPKRVSNSNESDVLVVVPSTPTAAMESLVPVFYTDKIPENEAKRISASGVPSWFVDITRDIAEHILTRPTVEFGTLLIRHSSSYPYSFALSLRHERTVVSDSSTLGQKSSASPPNCSPQQKTAESEKVIMVYHYEVAEIDEPSDSHTKCYRVRMEGQHPTFDCLYDVVKYFVALTRGRAVPLTTNVLSELGIDEHHLYATTTELQTQSQNKSRSPPPPSSIQPPPIPPPTQRLHSAMKKPSGLTYESSNEEKAGNATAGNQTLSTRRPIKRSESLQIVSEAKLNGKSDRKRVVILERESVRLRRSQRQSSVVSLRAQHNAMNSPPAKPDDSNTKTVFRRTLPTSSSGEDDDASKANTQSISPGKTDKFVINRLTNSSFLENIRESKRKIIRSPPPKPERRATTTVAAGAIASLISTESPTQPKPDFTISSPGDRRDEESSEAMYDHVKSGRIVNSSSPSSSAISTDLAKQDQVEHTNSEIPSDHGNFLSPLEETTLPATRGSASDQYTNRTTSSPAQATPNKTSIQAHEVVHQRDSSPQQRPKLNEIENRRQQTSSPTTNPQSTAIKYDAKTTDTDSLSSSPLPPPPLPPPGTALGTLLKQQKQLLSPVTISSTDDELNRQRPQNSSKAKKQAPALPTNHFITTQADVHNVLASNNKSITHRPLLRPSKPIAAKPQESQLSTSVKKSSVTDSQQHQVEKPIVRSTSILRSTPTASTNNINSLAQPQPSEDDPEFGIRTLAHHMKGQVRARVADMNQQMRQTAAAASRNHLEKQRKGFNKKRDFMGELSERLQQRREQLDTNHED